MRKFKFRYTLRNGQTGSGIILAPNIESVCSAAIERFNLHGNIRIYEVEEVLDEVEDTVG